jgi:hypothetical protein
MTAASANRNTPSREGSTMSYPMAAAVHAYAGALAVLDASGNCKPAVTATGLVPVGRFVREVNNSGGAAADLSCEVQPGIHRWENSAAGDAITKAEIGDRCYIVDDQTVAKTDGSSTRSPAGIVVAVDSLGVWVDTRMEVLVTTGLLAANNLSDLGSAATARGNLGGGANKVLLTLDPISTKASDAQVVRVVSPVAGTVDKIYSVLNAALATGDATLTAAINATPITSGVITITQAGSAAGDLDVATPSAAKTVAIGDVIKLTGGGASTATSTASVSLLITPSA